jgi:hypothetical protein
MYMKKKRKNHKCVLNYRIMLCGLFVLVKKYLICGEWILIRANQNEHMTIYMITMSYLNHCYEHTSFFYLISIGITTCEFLGIITIPLI